MAQLRPSWGQLGHTRSHLGAYLGSHGPILAPTWAIRERFWGQRSQYSSHLGLPPATLGPTMGQPRANFVQLGPTWSNGVILGPFWNNFEAICQVELSSRSFHALSCPVASSTVYRARPLVCRVIKPVVSCAALADCFDSCIQTAIYTTLLQLPCRLTEFGRKSFQLSLS